MLSWFWTLFWVGLVGLAAAAGVAARARLRASLTRRGPRVDDGAVRSILETGRLVTDEDEPLDLREIEEEERRFWAEEWEEPEEW